MKTFHQSMARSITVVMLALLSLGLTTPILSVAPASAATSALDFRNAMRKLWEDHITWTRLYIVEAVAGLPQANTTAQRLLANQDDIGNAVKPFYGDAAGDQLTALLKDHITGAVKILTAAKAGDNAGLKTASDEWYANANDIATFLNKANPQNIPLDQIQSDMKMHLDLTLQEAVDQLKGNYPAAVSDYDKVHEEILGMADMLSGGIINQFPDMFGGAPTVGMPRTGNPQGVPSDVSAALAVIAGLLVTAGWLLRRRSIAS